MHIYVGLKIFFNFPFQVGLNWKKMNSLDEFKCSECFLIFTDVEKFVEHAKAHEADEIIKQEKSNDEVQKAGNFR